MVEPKGAIPPSWEQPANGGAGLPAEGYSGRSLASVVAPFRHGFAAHGSECSLKECIVNNVGLVVFTFDDPVARECSTLADDREENGCVPALPCFY